MSILEFSFRAQLDLLSIQEHVALHDPIAAGRVVTRICRSIERLARHPLLGRPWQGGPTRALSIPDLPYRAHYQLTGDIVEILTVVHTRRQFPP